eukprot:COSAG06_NODE_2513_length_6737_cov_2.945014_7_plen_60_part_00
MSSRPASPDSTIQLTGAIFNDPGSHDQLRRGSVLEKVDEHYLHGTYQVPDDRAGARGRD